MNANPGDLVVVVNTGTILCDDAIHLGGHIAGAGLRLGSVVRVDSVTPAKACTCLEVHFLGTTAHIGRFRKLNDEPDNAELIALIKRPVRKPVTA